MARHNDAGRSLALELAPEHLLHRDLLPGPSPLEKRAQAVFARSLDDVLACGQLHLVGQDRLRAHDAGLELRVGARAEFDERPQVQAPLGARPGVLILLPGIRLRELRLIAHAGVPHLHVRAAPALPKLEALLREGRLQPLGRGAEPAGEQRAVVALALARKVGRRAGPDKLLHVSGVEEGHAEAGADLDLRRAGERPQATQEVAEPSADRVQAPREVHAMESVAAAATAAAAAAEPGALRELHVPRGLAEGEEAGALRHILAHIHRQLARQVGNLGELHSRDACEVEVQLLQEGAPALPLAQHLKHLTLDRPHRFGGAGDRQDAVAAVAGTLTGQVDASNGLHRLHRRPTCPNHQAPRPRGDDHLLRDRVDDVLALHSAPERRGERLEGP
mmetsp:Transcript_5211/g.14125  ORF Transcript_5211/g.14125 Transcript_5211/m.14125 type:complete len:391 (+) Transcript_5211:344-1516(+)